MRKVKNLIYGTALIFIMIGSSLYFLQEKLIFLPTRLKKDFQFEFQHQFEELFLEAQDGAMINALHFKAKEPKGVILYFHGNAGDLSRWGNITSYLVDKRFDVLIMDYRTYGKSTGKLSEKALYDDALMCYSYLLKSYKEEDIILYGRSLGTGIATYLASVKDPQQLILETPYYSLVDVAKRRFPVLPVSLFLKYRIPSHEFIQDVNCPVTFFHGSDDSVVSIESGKKLFETFNSAKKTFVEIEDGRHNNLIMFDEYQENIQSILK